MPDAKFDTLAAMQKLQDAGLGERPAKAHSERTMTVRLGVMLLGTAVLTTALTTVLTKLF